MNFLKPTHLKAFTVLFIAILTISFIASITSNRTAPISIPKVLAQSNINPYQDGTLINALYNLSSTNDWLTNPNTPWDSILDYWNTTLNEGASGVDLMMEGVQLENDNLSYVQSFIDNCKVPIVIMYFYSTYGIKLGLTPNQTSIEWALDAIHEMSNGLPQSSGITNAYSIYQGYLLYVYYWANYYQYDRAKWDLTKGYASFKAATYDGANGYSGVLTINDDNSYVSYDRYYDEWGETARNFLIFYSFGITDALNLVLAAWNYWNSVDWNDGGYYQYRPSGIDFECEAGFFLQDVLKLQYAYTYTLDDETRLLQDIETRFLSSGWTSPQWMYADSSTVDHTVVHAHSSNGQYRLSNTLGAWEALYGEWANFTDSDKIVVRSMILGNGQDNYVYPAWEYLYQSSLYNPADNTFKWVSTDSEGGNDQNIKAAILMLIQGIVPQTATLAVPLSEWRYEDCSNMIDPQLLSLNFSSNQLTVGIAAPGNVTFIFGTTPIDYTFNYSGVFTLQFTSDWNQIKSYIKTTLPTRIYFDQALNIVNPAPSPTPTPSPSLSPTLTQTPTQKPTPTPTPSPSLTPEPTAPRTISRAPSSTPTPIEITQLKNKPNINYIFLIVVMVAVATLLLLVSIRRIRGKTFEEGLQRS